MSENSTQPPEFQTSYAKGYEFEKLFAEFMKSDLGWEKYVIRSQQKGKRNSRGSQVDIIGERHDVMGNRYKAVAFIYSGIMILLMIIAFYYNETLLVFLALAIGIAGVVFAYISRDRHKENAWVECKNRKEKSTYEDMRKSIDEYMDYKESGDKEYRYVAHYFVSANGFVKAALKCAEDNKVICYELKNGKFEKVTYWQ